MVSGPQHGVEGHVDQLLRGCNNDLLCADCLVEHTNLPPQGWCALRVCVAQAQVLPPVVALCLSRAGKLVPRPQHGMERHVGRLPRTWHENILCAHLLLEPRPRLSHLPEPYDGVSKHLGIGLRPNMALCTDYVLGRLQEYTTSLQECLGGGSHVPALVISQFQGLTHGEGLTVTAAECIRRAEFVFGHKPLHMCTLSGKLSSTW